MSSFNDQVVLPVHEQLEQVVRGDLLSGKWPEEAQLPSEPNLAKHYRVSRNTLRKVLERLADEGLLKRRHGKGTFVCKRSDLHRKDQWIGILIEIDLSHPDTSFFWLKSVQELRNFFTSHNIPARLYVGMREPFGDDHSSTPTCQEFLEDLDNGKMSGVIGLAFKRGPSLTQRLHRQGVPVAFPHDLQLFDYRRFVEKGVRALADKECSRIAFLTRHSPQNVPSWEKYFKEALSEMGLRLIDCPIASSWPKTEQTDPVAALKSLWEQNNPKPDGLLVSDELLYHAIEPALIHNHIQVPDKLKIATHFNQGNPRFPLLPVIRVEANVKNFAERLAHLLLSRLTNPEKATEFNPLKWTVTETATSELPILSGSNG